VTAFVLKDAADRGRLGASTFRLLNLALTATLLQQVRHVRQSRPARSAAQPAGFVGGGASAPGLSGCGIAGSKRRPPAAPSIGVHLASVGALRNLRRPGVNPQAWYIWTLSGAGVALQPAIWRFALAKTALVAAAAGAACVLETKK
jgi:hypothetical protein